MANTKAGKTKPGGARAGRPKKKPPARLAAAPAKRPMQRRVVKDPAREGTVSLEVARAVADNLRRNREAD